MMWEGWRQMCREGDPVNPASLQTEARNANCCSQGYANSGSCCSRKTMLPNLSTGSSAVNSLSKSLILLFFFCTTGIKRPLSQLGAKFVTTEIWSSLVEYWAQGPHNWCVLPPEHPLVLAAPAPAPALQPWPWQAPGLLLCWVPGHGGGAAAALPCSTHASSK